MLSTRADYTMSRHLEEVSDFHQSNVCPERFLDDGTPGCCPESTSNTDSWVQSSDLPDQSTWRNGILGPQSSSAEKIYLEDISNTSRRNSSPLKSKGRDWVGKYMNNIKNFNPCETVSGPKQILTQCLIGIHWNFPNWMQWEKAQTLITCLATKLKYSTGKKKFILNLSKQKSWVE